MNTIASLGEKCTGCSACMQNCPQSCIAMQEDAEGFLYPQIDEASCVECGLCRKVCPVIEGFHGEHEPVAYAAKCNDDTIRNASSSGGVFTLLAQTVIDWGGVVFGAGFDDAFNVVHIGVENKADLAKLRGSKYVQSRIEDTFQQAKKHLDSGRPVYFSGTPCQIEGLHSFLGKPYDGLITQDIICHGVPSPMVWLKYVQYREAKARGKLSHAYFRHKQYGWHTFSMCLDFQNGTQHIQPLSRDIYLRSFLRNLCLRPSCYACEFKKISRASDFTLADFWGVQEKLPWLDDDKGTSLVICHTSKAQKLFAQIQDETEFAQADLQEAISHNLAMCKPVPRPSQRDAFMKQMQLQRFEKAAKKFCRVPSVPERAVRKLFRIIRNVVRGK